MQTDHSLVKKGENDLAGVMRALAEKIAVHAPSRGATAVGVYPALAMYRYEGCIDRQRYVQEPAVCLVVQGRQQVVLNQEEYTFASAQYLLSSVALPVTARILEAAQEQPCLGLSLGLDYQQLPQLLGAGLQSLAPTRPPQRAIGVGRLDVSLAQAFLRLLNLLDQPQDIPVLAPLLQREILYRLLIGDQGHCLQQMGITGSHSQQVARVIDWLRKNYDQSFAVDELARLSGLEPLRLQYYFQAMTAMSPLQFQKELQFNERSAGKPLDRSHENIRGERRQYRYFLPIISSQQNKYRGDPTIH